MKKFFSLLSMLLICAISFGQSFPVVQSNTNGNLKSTAAHAATDTITNAVTKYQYAEIRGYNDVVTVQPTFVKISGTAAATVKLQGSVDGTSFNDIAGATYTVTDVASQSTAFVVTPSNFQVYRLSIVPTGTQSVKVTTPVIARKRS